MKLFVATLACWLFVWSASAEPLPSECRWGASYWCRSQAAARRCGQVDYCKNNVWRKATPATTTATKVSSSGECEVCSVVTHLISSIMKSAESETKAKTLVEKACSVMSGEMSTECTKIIEDYFDMIWRLVQMETDNDAICKQVGLCSSTLTAKPNHVSQPPCELCKLVATFLETIVDRNTTENEAKDAVEKFCDLLPGSVKSECTALVDQYFDALWQIVEKELDSGEICSQIGLCNTKRSMKMSVPAKQNHVSQDLCDLCKLVAGFVKHFVDGNGTENEAKEAVEEVCKMLPSAVSSQCTSLVDTYFPLVWTLVKSEIDSGDVCSQIGLCNTTRSMKMFVHVPTKQNHVSDQLCDLCKLVSNYLKHFVDSSSSEQEAKSAVEQLCKLLPGNISSTCNSLVDSYFDLVWTLLKQEVDSVDICSRIGLCNTTRSMKMFVHVPTKQNHVSEGLCDICNLMVNFLKQYVDSSTTEAEIKSTVERMCGSLPGDISSECSTLVDQYFDLVWRLLQAYVDAGEICSQIGLCNRTRSMKTLVHVPAKQNHVSDQLCDICNLVTTFLKQYVDNSATENEAKEAVEKLCSVLPGNASSECTSLVNTYFDLAWGILKTEIDSGKVCSQIGLCNTTRTMKTPVPAKQNHVSEDLCDVCKMVTDIVKKYVDDSKTEEEVKNDLEQVCSSFPGTLGTTCSDLVNQYFDLIWGLVKSEIDSGQVCAVIGLCSNSVSVSPRVSKPVPLEGDIECSLCKYVVGKLEGMVTANSTEAEVEKLLDEVCDDVSIIKQECIDLVQQFVPVILDYLINKVDPGTVCAVINLCKNNSRTVLLGKQLKAPGFFCKECMKLTGDIISAVMGDSIETKVEKTVTGICVKLPSKVDVDECQSLLKAFFPIVWNFIKSEIDSQTLEQEACSLIKVCKAPVKTRSVMAPQGPIKCVVCKLIAHELEKLVDKNSTKSDIEGALKKVCSIIPSKYRAKCTSFLEGEGDEIITKILDDGPSVICAAVCILKTKEITAVAMPKNTITCDACTEVLELLKNYLTSDKSEVVSLIMDVCDVMPSTVKPECDDFVKMYGPDVVEIIANYIDPKTMCQQFCTARRFKSISLRAGRHRL